MPASQWRNDLCAVRTTKTEADVDSAACTAFIPDAECLGIRPLYYQMTKVIHLIAC